MTSVNPSGPIAPFLVAGETLDDLIAAFDWGQTSVGSLENWDASLQTAVSLVLRSTLPMVVLWGEDGVLIYNHAYTAIAGNRHPALLGMPALQAWPEVADLNAHVLAQCLAGHTLTYRDLVLTLHRGGRDEPMWVNLDYSPICAADGSIRGVLAVVVETTEKVRAQRRVSGERECLHRMFAQTPSFMAMLHGPEHVFDLANPAYMQLVGHRDVLGKSVRAAIPDIEGQGFFELLDQVYASGKAYFGESMPALLQRTPGASPEQRYVDLVFQPLRDDDDQVIGIFVEGSDVTARVQAEAAVRASELQLREFAQAMPNHVWAARPDGQIDWFNDRLISYSGLSLQELQNRPWHAMVHAEDADRAQRQWAHALISGQPYEVEFRLRRADGSYFWHLSRAQPIRDDQGRITRWIGTNTDIDEQKRTTRALAHLNEHLEQQIAARTADRDRMWRLTTDAMLVADLEMRIVSVNPACTTLLGWSPLELLGRNFMDFVHPDDCSDTLAEVDGLARGMTVFRLESRYQRKDGQYSVMLWTAVPEAGFIHAVGRDVTSDREAALALQSTQAALYQAQKMESIGQLTGGVAHDFNNLLQVISGNLQLLSRTVKGQERSEGYVKNALDGVRRAAKLSNQLLSFSRRQPLEPKTVNLGRFILGMEDMLRHSVGEGIEIEMKGGHGLWNSFADPTQVENALLNLAINARDAMNGTGHLTIEACNALLDEAYVLQHPDVQAGQYVMLSVADTGTGMQPEVLEKVFEPFFSTKPEGKGSGLGLSMVYGFVKQSGGHIHIYSTPGQGTTVKLYLPRSLEDEVVAAPALPQALGGSETILVAEDNEGVRATVVELLQQLGYQVLQASDATSALALLQGGTRVDLLFTDVVMPGPLRSPELARRARELWPDIAVLFTSGYAQDAIVHGGRLDPGLDLLGKPYTQDALARKLRHVLAYQQRAAPAWLPVAAPATPSNPTLDRESPAMTDLSAFAITQKWPAQHPERLQLYSLPTPNGVKAAIMLEELGLPYEPHRVSFDTQDQMSPAFLSLNPNNKIPAIIDPDGPDGVPLALFESGAILVYLADKTGQLLAPGGAARYETLQWLMWQMGGVGPMFGQLGFFHKFAGKDYEDKRPRDRYAAECTRLLAVLDQRLQGRDWIMGAHYSIADIAVLPWVRNLVGFYDAGALVGFERFVNVQRVLAAWQNRSAVQRGLEIPRAD